MKAAYRNRVVAISALLAGSAMPLSSASAQKVDPKVERYLEGSVDLYFGSLTHANTDLAFGPSPDEGGLAFTRYIGSSSNSDNGPSVDHNLQVMIFRKWWLEPVVGPDKKNYDYNIVLGATKNLFQKTYSDPPLETMLGANFATLALSGVDGPYVYTARDGTKVDFPALKQCLPAYYGGINCNVGTRVTRPNGVVTNFHYAPISSDTDIPKVQFVATNRGYALGIEYTSNGRVSKACAINLATTYAAPGAPCPAGTPTATYTYTYHPSSPQTVISSTFTDATGVVTTYSYGDYLESVQTSGRAVPDVTIAYSATTGRVSSLTYADGSAWSYTYQQTEPPWITITNEWTRVTDPLGKETLHNFAYGQAPKPGSITDPLGRTTQFRYGPGFSPSIPTEQTNPEGDVTRNTIDSRGRTTEARRIAKPGAGLADTVQTATFPSGCLNTPTCEAPLSRTDANNNTTTYTYDPVHGGVLTETSPAVAGVQAVKRFTYAQHYAWLKTSGSGYVQAASPIWLLAEERTCRTSATVGNACAAGASDEVVVSYQYEAGNTATPSNLLLKGKTVTADGQTLRTCYGYDSQGRKIWETTPRAGLSTCA